MRKKKNTKEKPLCAVSASVPVRMYPAAGKGVHKVLQEATSHPVQGYGSSCGPLILVGKGLPRLQQIPEHIQQMDNLLIFLLHTCNSDTVIPQGCRIPAVCITQFKPPPAPSTVSQGKHLTGQPLLAFPPQQKHLSAPSCVLQHPPSWDAQPAGTARDAHGLHCTR